MTPTPIIAFLIGASLGAVYFLLLWLSLPRLLGSQGSPGTAAFVLMALLRMGMVIAALFVALTTGTPLPAIAAGVAGFVLARIAATQASRRTKGAPAPWT